MAKAIMATQEVVNVVWTGDAGDLKKLLEPLVRVNSEARLEVKDGWGEIRIVDPAHVGFARVRFQTGAARGSWGLNLDEIKEALKPFAAESSVELAVLDVKNASLNGEGVRKLVKLADLESMPDPKLPRLEHVVTLSTTKEKLASAVKHASPVSDHLALWVKPDGKALALAVGDRGEVEANLGEASDWMDGQARDVACLYSLDYLDKLVGAIPAKTPVSCSFGFDFPVQMNYVAGGAEVVALLAPRIESEGGVIPEIVAERMTPAPSTPGAGPGQQASAVTENSLDPAERPKRLDRMQAYIQEIQGEDTPGNRGAHWDLLMARATEWGWSAEEAEEVICELIDHGRVYEPVITYIRTT
jgi:hypothetical protein